MKSLHFHESKRQILVPKYLDDKELGGPIPSWLPTNMRESLVVTDHTGKRIFVAVDCNEPKTPKSGNQPPLKKRRLSYSETPSIRTPNPKLTENAFDWLPKNMLKALKQTDSRYTISFLKQENNGNDRSHNIPRHAQAPLAKRYNKNLDNENIRQGQSDLDQSNFVDSITTAIFDQLNEYAKTCHGLRSDVGNVVKEALFGDESTGISQYQPFNHHVDLSSAIDLVNNLHWHKRLLHQAQSTLGEHMAKLKDPNDVLGPSLPQHGIVRWGVKIAEMTNKINAIKKELKFVIKTLVANE